MNWLHTSLQSVATVHADATGTGFVVSMDGHLVTAAHCVVDDSGESHRPSDPISVVYRDQTGTEHRVPATLLGFDMHADVAVLQLPLDAPRLPPPIPLRIHTYPTAGDTCVVVGNLFGQDPRSVAVGTVRNGRWKDPRGLSLLTTVLTDVATGSGTSGGPILDAAGYVVALHTAAYGGPEGAQSPDSATTQLGGGVASPMLRKIVSAILMAASVTGPVSPAVPDRYVLPCDTRPSTILPSGYGVVGTDIYHPFRRGDVVTRVQGHAVGPGPDDATPADVTWLLGLSTCHVDVLRDGKDTRLDNVGLVRISSELDRARGVAQKLELSLGSDSKTYDDTYVVHKHQDIKFVWWASTIDKPRTYVCSNDVTWSYADGHGVLMYIPKRKSFVLGGVQTFHNVIRYFLKYCRVEYPAIYRLAVGNTGLDIGNSFFLPAQPDIVIYRGISTRNEVRQDIYFKYTKAGQARYAYYYLSKDTPGFEGYLTNVYDTLGGYILSNHKDWTRLFSPSVDAGVVTITLDDRVVATGLHDGVDLDDYDARYDAVYKMLTGRSRLVTEENGGQRSHFTRLIDLCEEDNESTFWYICNQGAQWVFPPERFVDQAALKTYKPIPSYQFDSSNGSFHIDLSGLIPVGVSTSPAPPLERTFAFTPDNWMSRTDKGRLQITYGTLTVTRGEHQQTVHCVFEKQHVSIPNVNTPEDVANSILTDPFTILVDKDDDIPDDRSHTVWSSSNSNQPITTSTFSWIPAEKSLPHTLWYVRASTGSYVLHGAEWKEVGAIETYMRTHNLYKA